MHEPSGCLSDFTDARPYLDKSAACNLPFVIAGFDDPAKIDFVNNVSVFRAPIRWENHSDEDDDYTLNLHSAGGELYDTQEAAKDPHVHVEFDSDESIDDFTDKDTAVGSFGAANQWWTQLRDTVDNSPGSDDQKDINVRCFMEKFVNPSLSTAICDALPFSSPLTEPTCPERPGGRCKDPMAVVVGVISRDCGDHPKDNTSEVHPAYAVAIRIQESTQENPQPEQWAFFYRDSGDNGACGSSVYRRCGTTFQLPLSLPFIPDGQVLTGADVQVDWHAWAVDGSFPSDVTVEPRFDLANGTVLSVTLPGKTDIIDIQGNPVVVPVGEGVVGLVTVTSVLDTTPPQLTCPAPIVVDATGPSGAVVSYAPSVSDDCSVASVACTPPSGTTFAVGDSTAGCTAADAANNTSSCSFTIHVKGAAEQIGDLITTVNGLAMKNGIRNSLLAKLTAALARLQGSNPAAACGSLRAFINEVNAQRGKSISASDADALVTAATRIIAVNGCRA